MKETALYCNHSIKSMYKYIVHRHITVLTVRPYWISEQPLTDEISQFPMRCILSFLHSLYTFFRKATLSGQSVSYLPFYISTIILRCQVGFSKFC